MTATPVENRLDDLFHLVSLVRPGHLGTLAEFRRRHGSRPTEAASAMTSTTHQATTVTPVAELAELRRSLRDVMVRHRRSDVALMLPHRLAETVLVTPSSEEALLYREISRRVREEGPSLEVDVEDREARGLLGTQSACSTGSRKKPGGVDLGNGEAALRRGTFLS